MTDPAALWDFDDPAGSAARFRAAAVGSDRPVMLTQVARALGLQEEYAEAHALLDAVAADPVPPAADEAEVRTRVALERGRLLRSAGEPEAARPHFEEAVDLARTAGLRFFEVDALHMCALVAGPTEAERLTERALEIARGSEDPRVRGWEASLLNNRGMAQVDAGDLEGALATFTAAREARERLGRPAGVRVARWMEGWTLRLLGRRTEALAVQRALAAELEEAGETDPYVDEELALLLDERRDPAS